MNPDVRIAADSPIRICSPAAKARCAVWRRLTSLRRVLAHAMRRRHSIDALLCSGDIVNDEPGGYAHFARELCGSR